MRLRGKKPEPQERRLKMFVYGPAGVGKTTCAIQFPHAYIIDTEHGTTEYAASINKAESVVLQTSSIDEIKQEITTLLTEQHEFRTLILDPITPVYEDVQEKWTRRFIQYAKSDKESSLQDFGPRFWGKVKGDFKGIRRLWTGLDMNVIVLAHQKDMYGPNMTRMGVTFDSMKGDDYVFDLVFRVERRGKETIAVTIKERAEPLTGPKFPEEFVWTYENFKAYYGADIIERKATPVAMASKAQVEAIEKLLEVVKLDDATREKWFNKANVDGWSEMTADTLSKCIERLNKQLKSLENGGTQQ